MSTTAKDTDKLPQNGSSGNTVKNSNGKMKAKRKEAPTTITTKPISIDPDKVPQENVTTTLVTRNQDNDVIQTNSSHVIHRRIKNGRIGCHVMHRRIKNGRIGMTARKSTGERKAKRKEPPMTARKSTGERKAKTKEPPITITTEPISYDPKSGWVIRRNRMKRENPPTTATTTNTTTTTTTIPNSTPNDYNVGSRRSRMIVRNSNGQTKSQPPPTHPYSDSYGYTFRNRDEADRIATGEVTAKVTSDWDYSVLLSDLPSSNIDEDDGNKNLTTDKK